MDVSRKSVVRRSRASGRGALFALLVLVMSMVPVFSPSAGADPASDGNPDLPPSCGIDVTMILDHSGSINSSETQLVRNAAQTFASALVGTPSKLKTVVFSTRAQGVNASGSLTPNVNNVVFRDPASYTPPISGAGNGGTNWDDALEVARTSAGGPGNLVVFITDGDPTYHNATSPGGHKNDGTTAIAGNGNTTSAADQSNAVTQADMIKSGGAHMFGIGVGLTGSASKTRLSAVTGNEEMSITGGVPTPSFSTADYIVTPDFTQLQSVISAFVRQMCGQTLNVTKMLQKADGTTVKAGASTPWTFNASFATNPPATWNNPSRPDNSASGSLTTDDSGGVSFSWDSGAVAADRTATLTETSQSGWVYNGASCSVNDFSGSSPRQLLNTVGANAPGSVGNITDVAALPISTDKAVNCTVYNRQLRTSTISVTKVTQPANEPGKFDFTLSKGSTTVGTVTGLSHGQTGSFGAVTPGTYAISEAPSANFDLASATCDNLATTSVKEAVAATNLIVGEGQNWQCTFTNAAKPGSIKIVKKSVGANGTFGFTSNVPGLDNFSLTTNGGTASTATVVVPVGSYHVAESTPSQWTLTSATCSDGSSPSNITVDPGENVICTFTNTAPAPTIAVTKSANVSTVPEPGGPVTYTVSVHNTSVEALTVSAVSDAINGGAAIDVTHAGGPITATTCGALIGATLAIGGSASCTFTANVTGNGGSTETDVATVSAKDADGNTATASDDAAVGITVVPPSMKVTKTPSVSSMHEPGAPVTYTVGITNTSPEALTLDTFTDSVDGGPAIDVTKVAGKVTATTCDGLVGTQLAPKASTSCTFTYAFTGVSVATSGGTVHDTVTVVGHDDDGQATASANAEVAVLDTPPVVMVTKSANPSSVAETAPGQTRTVTYTVGVHNGSVEPVTVTAIVDSVDGAAAVPVGGSCAGLIGTVLAVGQTVSCSFTGQVAGNAGDQVHDTVTATVTDDEGDNASDNASATVSFIDVSSSITVAKSANPSTVPENGGTVTYPVTITNTSATDTVVIGSITDAVGGAAPFAVAGSCAALIGRSLTPGQSVSCSFTLQVAGNAGDQVHDTVTVTGTDDDGHTVSNHGDATVTITDLPSSLSVDKSAAVSSVDEPGGPVTYTVQITNTSVADTVTLSSITDAVGGGAAEAVGGTCAALVGMTLAPSQTVECTFVGQVTGKGGDKVVDTVTVTGTDDDGHAVSNHDDATVTIDDVPPSGTVTKTPSSDTIPENGGTVTFAVVVHNTSVEPVTVTAITDQSGGVTYDVTTVAGPITSTTCAAGTVLAPGESYHCSFGFAVAAGKAGDVVADTVMATLVDDEGDMVGPTDDAEVTLTDVKPTITVTKDKITPGRVAPGDPVKFRVTVTNTSVEAVTITSLVDSIDGAAPVDVTKVHGPITATSCAIGGSLAVGASYECTFTAIVTSAVARSVPDKVTAEVTDDEGDRADGSDTASTPVVPIRKEPEQNQIPTTQPEVQVPLTPTTQAPAQPVSRVKGESQMLPTTGSRILDIGLGGLMVAALGAVLVATTRRRRRMT